MYIHPPIWYVNLEIMADHYGDNVSCGIIVFISLFLGKLRKHFAADLSFVPVLRETEKIKRILLLY